MPQVECSICEFVFNATARLGQATQCPCCQNAFVLSADSFIGTEKPSTAPPAPPVTGQSLTGLAEVNISTVRLRARQIERTRSRRRVRLLVTALLLALSIAAALVLIRRTRLGTPENQHAAGPPIEQPADGDAGAAGTTKAPQQNPQNDRQEQPIAAATVPEKSPPQPPLAIPSAPAIPEPTFLFTDRKNARRLWERIQPQLLLLEIESPAGRTTAVGTIIDSRGYVATSLATIDRAWSIRVKPSNRTAGPLAANPANALTDEVRGIAAKSPEQGLAILSVNRRFVISLSETEIAAEDRIVAKKPLVRLTPPTPQSPWSFSETRIAKKRKINGLTEDDQTHIGQQHPLAADHFWLRCHRSPLDRPGTPLFTEDGTLVAMLASSNSENSFYVSTVPLIEMLGSLSGNVQSLPGRPNDANDANDANENAPKTKEGP